MEKLLLDFTMSDSGIGVQYAPRPRAKLVLPRNYRSTTFVRGKKKEKEEKEKFS